jgi:NAD+ synthase (glutamine-hydrolysing)
MLLNTGNKSEAAMGYSTLYGDTAGAFAPLGNIYKEDVYGLATWRNESGPVPVIPQTTIDKPPSAELYEDQRDSDSLPPYDVLDRILRLHFEAGLGADRLIDAAAQEQGEKPLDPKLVTQVLNTVRAAEFKRRQEPLAPNLSGTSIVDMRNWPITNGFVDRAGLIRRPLDIPTYLGMVYSWNTPGTWDALAN